MSLPDAVQRGFDRARQAMAVPMVWVHLGAEVLWLVRQSGIHGTESLDLDLGTHSTARHFFKSDPPAPMELERAIDHIEDELMRALVWSGGCTTLVTDHPMVRSMAQSAAALSLESVEAQFQRLASGSLGLPSALKGLPPGREAAAALLILRELMHHLKFNQVVVAPPSPDASLP
jgi:exopolyphosphatase/pppGpp-phosphohydrolase